MPSARINGIRLHYEDSGEGEPVVLVMGQAAGGRAWHLHQVPALVDAGYRAVTFHNRGVPPTDECPDGFTVDDLVADTAGLAEHLGLAPCRFVGVSLGAYVVQELMLARPQLVRQGVLMATRGRTDVLRAAMTNAERALYDSGLDLPVAYTAWVRALQNLSPATLDDDRRVQDWLELFEFSPQPQGPGVRAQLDLDVPEGRLDAYRDVDVPCLVVGFADDVILPPHLGREVADAIPGAVYQEIKGCGHYGYLERPDEVNRVLMEFFGDGPAARPSAPGDVELG
ncbi:alpha/beta hydrolase [Streptomyces cyaneochromogenes]|uniref:Alpha/beta hydrolase n=1 Tax=Streptomyces cyaneochromogenes TaxID=2496836 RepID=A0A3S9MJ16_9ACTN|nr:alpha/beta hydrolase [Streptomyces cyaneochromogenes]AZQ39168.1 alpha/beta hydrolase [Streptomyces cyaneochromogenes]